MTNRRIKPEIKSLYYITHIENLQSILKNGIYSHSLIQDTGVSFVPIYDNEIVSNRKQIITPSGENLWYYANIYFQPRNPMLYRVKHEKDISKIAIIGIYPEVMSVPGVLLTDGNAANNPTIITTYSEGIKKIAANWDILNSEWWNSVDGSKRKIMAECLVPNKIPPNYIHSIYVANHHIAETVRNNIRPNEIPIIPEPKMFFYPERRIQITPSLTLAEGDMFFSNMQTLTVSVNTVGIMGKGLASRAKYQFPDVYVTYQDACRKKWLKMGKPYLYKREASFDGELIDEPESAPNLNSVKWFLLFATKNHWREDSDFDGIVNGLEWVKNNYEKEGIKSLALPALGCGLGNLDWNKVGPVMCQYLGNLNIKAVIYLPREKQILNEFLTSKYLLGSGS